MSASYTRRQTTTAGNAGSHCLWPTSAQASYALDNSAQQTLSRTDRIPQG